MHSDLGLAPDGPDWVKLHQGLTVTTMSTEQLCFVLQARTVLQ